MPPDAEQQSALAAAWHRSSAQSSLERWLQVCEQEGWGRLPEDIGLLVRVFGASWYFTRFVFYRGRAAARLFDDPAADFETLTLAGILDRAARGTSLEEKLEGLRVAKNELMLRILIASLRGELDAAREESALSRLAETVIGAVMNLFGLRAAWDGRRLAVLGMGRLAGEEMTYGSDLDLIFLFEPSRDGDTHEISNRVRALLRHIAAAAPSGTLYDIDMRLRPHGTAGALLTTAPAFIEYHVACREIWERQMMTRCRPVYDPGGLARATMSDVLNSVYGEYEPDRLCAAIREMRVRVDRELGRPQGKLELKRGRGGIMDIDFICHLLQLGHGHAHPALRICSTRRALRAAGEAGILDPDCAAELLAGYEFLRGVERCLRLYDLKNISAFPDRPEAVEPLARAMGYARSAEQFLDAYRDTTQRIRRRFDELVPDALSSG